MGKVHDEPGRRWHLPVVHVCRAPGRRWHLPVVHVCRAPGRRKRPHTASTPSPPLRGRHLAPDSWWNPNTRGYYQGFRLNSNGNCFPNCAPGITQDTRSCGLPPTSFFIASSYGFGMPLDPPTNSFYGECNIQEVPCRGNGSSKRFFLETNLLENYKRE